MRSKTAQDLFKDTPEYIKTYVDHNADLVVRVQEILESKGMSQKELAEKLEKHPSEVSKWLSGTHNLTLKTIARLEVALGAPLIHIPKAISHPA